MTDIISIAFEPASVLALINISVILTGALGMALVLCLAAVAFGFLLGAALGVAVYGWPRRRQRAATATLVYRQGDRGYAIIRPVGAA